MNDQQTLTILPGVYDGWGASIARHVVPRRYTRAGVPLRGVLGYRSEVSLDD